MKQKDFLLIAVIVIIGGVISYIVSNKFISPPKHDLKAAQVEAISSEFNEPDERYFNDSSVNPTQLIRIQNNSNTKPFNGQ